MTTVVSDQVVCPHGKRFFVITERGYPTPYHYPPPRYEIGVHPTTPEGEVDLGYCPTWDVADSEEEAKGLHFEMVGKLAVGVNCPHP